MARLPTPYMPLRLLALAVALYPCVSARAANYDPRIAYTSFEGKGDTIYLANADGSLKQAVYKTNKTTINGLDLGNGRVAFTESGVLKVLSYNVTSNGITATAPITLDNTGAPNQGAAQPDFSPDGNHLLYLRWVQDPDTGSGQWREIRVIPSNGSAPPKVLVTAQQLADTWHMQSPRWLNGSEFAFIRGGGTPYYTSVMLATVDASMDAVGAPLALFTNKDAAFTAAGLVGCEDFDIAHTRPSILLSCNSSLTGYLRTFVEYDLVNETFTSHFNDYGWKAHFQAGDASIVYSHLGSSSVVGNGVYRWTAATGRSTAISGKGSQSIGFVDARP